MRSLRSHAKGGPQTLQLDHLNPLTPNAGEVVIQVEACGVNFPDLLIIQDQYQFKPERPFAPGGEVAGVIIKTGEGVKHLKTGMRVLAMSGWGGFSEQVQVDARRVFPIPDQMDSITAATTLYTYGTALHALKDRAQVQTGETVLVLGAAGGVGLAAVELASVMGAEVVAAASSEVKLELCREKGAKHTINYNTEDLRAVLKEKFGSRGIDVVVDPVGGSYAEPALRSMGWNGRYLVVGFAAGDIPRLPFNLPLLKGCSVMGVFWGSFAERYPNQNLQNLMQLLQWMGSGAIRQHIHRKYTLEEAALALEDMSDRKIRGKAVVVMQEVDQVIKRKVDKQRVTTGEKASSGPKENVKRLQLKTIEDAKPHLGKTIGPTEWMTVTQEMINHFADATGDHQWMHVDEARAAKELPEGRCLAHGYFSLSLISKMVYELVMLEDVRLSLNYGTNKVRFPASVYSGDRLRMSAILEKLESRADGGTQITFSCTMVIEGKEKPACVAEVMSVVY